MSCKKCPHYVRHGQFNPQTNTIEFKDACGILLRQAAKLQEKENNKKSTKQAQNKEKFKQVQNVPLCKYYPFSENFEHTQCEIYQDYFKSITYKKDIMAESTDFQLSDIFSTTTPKLDDIDIL